MCDSASPPGDGLPVSGFFEWQPMSPGVDYSNPEAGRETALDRTVRSHSAAAARFLVRNASHYVVVAESRVLYFSSEDGLTMLVDDGTQYWMDPRSTNWSSAWIRRVSFASRAPR